MDSPHDIPAFAQRLRCFIKQTAGEGRGPIPDPSEETTGIGNEGFERLALELFALQFEYNPPYRKFCQKLGRTPFGIEHWSQIPALPPEAFKDFELTSLSPLERTLVFHSSGTTAQRPSRHFHCAESLKLYEDSLLPWFQRHLLARPADVAWPLRVQVIALTPRSELAPNSSLVHMFETVTREFGAQGSSFVGTLGQDGAWELDYGKLVSALNASIAREGPVLLLGTAFLFVHLLEHFGREELRLALPAGSRLMETGGYKGRSLALSKPELYCRLTDRLGVGVESIIGEYGMSELSSQAYDLAFTGTRQKARDDATALQQRSFRFPPWSRAQIVSPETGREVGGGEPGVLRIFDLANAWSALAIQTQDIAVKRGNGFELVGRAATAEPRGCSLMSADSL